MKKINAECEKERQVEQNINRRVEIEDISQAFGLSL